MSVLRGSILRLHAALRVAGMHLVLSVVVAVVVALLVIGWWFPFPYNEIAGGRRLLWLIITVDVVCGPLLTLILYSPTKTFRALMIDVILIVFVQLAALIYGLYSLSQAKPIALVFEVDRFRSISHADIPTESLPYLPEWASLWSIHAPRVMGIRRAATLEEKISSIGASLGGVEPSAQPQWWQDYQLSHVAVLERARVLQDLRLAYPQHVMQIDQATTAAVRNPDQNETKDANQLRWLPLVGKFATDWIVLIDPNSARIRGYINLDGFI